MDGSRSLAANARRDVCRANRRRGHLKTRGATARSEQGCARGELLKHCLPNSAAVQPPAVAAPRTSCFSLHSLSHATRLPARHSPPTLSSTAEPTHATPSKPRYTLDLSSQQLTRSLPPLTYLLHTHARKLRPNTHTILLVGAAATLVEEVAAGRSRTYRSCVAAVIARISY